MRLTWHIIAKDLRRLQVPLAIWVLLMLAEHVFYARIGGVWGAPDLEWLNRIQGGSELWLRIFALPLMAYFLIGALVYDDPLVEADPFWITRPISGRQLLAAKITGAILLFLVVPLLIKTGWWWACGLEAGEIAAAGGRVALLHGLLVAIGLTCASLTDGFPRYVMWTIVGFVILVLLNGATPLLLGKGFSTVGPIGLNTVLNRLALGGFTLTFVALVHQFTTRRLARSIAIIAVGLVATTLGAHLSATSTVETSRHVTESNNAQLQVTLAATPRFLAASPRGRPGGGAPHVQLPLAIRGASKDLVVLQVHANGEWSANGVKLWSASGGRQYLEDRATLRRVLGLPADPATSRQPPGSELQASLQLSPVVAQKIGAAPVAFHANLTILVEEKTATIEAPLRNGTTRGPGYSLTLSEVALEHVKDSRRRGWEAKGVATDGNVISLLLTQRLSDYWTGSRALRPNRPVIQYALLNRRTGELMLPDGPGSGTVAFTPLDQVDVLAMRLQFTGPSTAGWLDDAVLVLIRFDRADVLERTLDVNPFILEGAPAASATSL